MARVEACRRTCGRGPVVAKQATETGCRGLGLRRSEDRHPGQVGEALAEPVQTGETAASLDATRRAKRAVHCVDVHY